ncbi:MAG TPA: histidine kinase [Burkholderiaceae bacterium]|jgi:two-component system sensor histidine kinase AlgZ|nr:histidine kinase [Burkholderiaceae bacterium]
MPPIAIPAQAPVEIVIPDCCNIGVIFRALLAVNGAVLAVMLLRYGDWKEGLTAFIETATLVELACLSSLLALCGLRRAIRTIPPWGQRIACGLVPAAIAALIVRFLLADDAVLGRLARVSVPEGIAVAALSGIVLQHYFEMRTRAFSPALAEARLQALQARIRPHFLFNSLNAVLSLIRSEPRRAETVLEDLADLFRVLMRDARHVVTLEDEIRLCRQYLSIEKIRLGERLQVEWEIVDVGDDVLRKAKIPSLLLQPLLENAVHYGVEPARAPALIRIRLSRSIDRIEIAIVNPVAADIEESGAESQGNHMALENIRQRLALLHDLEAQLTTVTEAGTFEVRLRFPYARRDR